MTTMFVLSSFPLGVVILNLFIDYNKMYTILGYEV